MKTNITPKPLSRLDFSRVNTTLPDWPDNDLLKLDKVRIKSGWDEPEIGGGGILGPVLSIVGAIAAPALIPALPGLGFLGTIIKGASWYSGLVKAGLGAVGGFIGGTIGNIISPAPQPSFGNLTSQFKDQPFIDSPTFSLKGIQNMTQPDGPVPVIYGERRVGGVLISQRLETVGDDTFFWGLFLLGEGEVESICAAGLSDLHINGQPGTNFSDVTLWTRTGTHTQTVIPGFEELTVTYSQNSKLTSSPVVYTTVSSAAIGFRLHIEAPQGVYSINNNGDVVGNSVKYKVEYRVNGDPGWIDAGDTTISAAKIGTVRDVFLKQSLTADKYDVRITRVSAEQTGAKNRSDIWFVGIDEITGDEFVYPHCALGAVKIKATNQLNGPVPTITFLVKGIKVKDVTNLGAAARWSRNPADGYYDLLTNARYGLGRFIAATDVNDTQIAVEAAYFDTTTDDGAGGTEIRNQMDAVLDTHSDAQQLLVQLMSSFRASPLWSEGLTSLVVDRVKNPVHIFNMGNITQGSYASSFPDIKKAPNRIVVQFPNKANNYKLEPISVTDEASITAGAPIRTESIMAAPVTRLSEVHRLANYKKNTSKYITRAEEHSVPPEALDLQAGDTYLLQHDVPQWGWGGRIENVTGSTITVDLDLTIEAAKSYVLQARLPDGTIEERVVTNAAETTKVIFLASAFSAAPNRMTPYFFGETTNKKLFTCVSITMQPDGNRRIAGVEYNANTYNEITLLPTHNASALPTPEGIPPDIENLTLFENQSQPQSIIVSFNIPNPAQSWNHAVIELSSDGGTTYFPHVTVDNAADVVINNLVVGQQYYVRMSSFSRNNVISVSPPTANITITGSPFTPPTVRGLEIKGQGNTVTFTGRDVSFTWKKNNPIFGVGVDGAGSSSLGAGDGADSPTFKDYKVDIYVNSAIVRTSFVKENSYRYTEQMNIEDNSGAGVRAFQLRVAERNSFNKTGGEAILDVNNPAPDMSTFTPVLTNVGPTGIKVSWLNFTPSDKDFHSYKLYIDTNNPPQTLIAEFSADTKQFITDQLDIENTTYYVQIAPSDVFGTGTASGVANITTLSTAIDITDVTPPAVPTGLALTSGVEPDSDGTQKIYIQADWDVNTESDFNDYIVRIKISGGNYTLFNTGLNTFKFTGIIGNTTYLVSVRAVDVQQNKSAFSADASILAAKDTAAPATPSGLTAIAGFKLIGLKWNQNAEGDLKSYRIERSATGAFTGEEVSLKDSLTHFFVDSALAVATQYWYRIAAVDTSGNVSGWSTVANTTTLRVGQGEITASTALITELFATQALVDQLISQINGQGVTKISPGLIEVSGAASLADWRHGSNLTKIDGGNIYANSILASSVKVGNRNITFDGVEISSQNPTVDTLYWTAGNISYINDAGSDVSVAISSGNALWTTGVLYLYWAKDATSLTTTTTRSTAFGADNVVIATYKGGTDMTALYGRTIIDGSDILAATVGASQLVTSTAIITTAAQIANAIIGDAKITDVAAGKLSAGTIAADLIINAFFRTATSGGRIEIDGGAATPEIKLFDTGGVQRGSLKADGSGWFGSSTAFSWTPAGAVTIDGNVASINNLDAAQIRSNTTITNLIKMGDDKFQLDAPNRHILIKDNQITPQNRVKLGKLGAGTTDYGIEIYNSGGTKVFGVNGMETQGIVSEAVTKNDIASTDGNIYARCDGTWTTIQTLVFNAAGEGKLIIFGKAHLNHRGGAAGGMGIWITPQMKLTLNGITKDYWTLGRLIIREEFNIVLMSTEPSLVSGNVTVKLEVYPGEFVNEIVAQDAGIDCTYRKIWVQESKR